MKGPPRRRSTLNEAVCSLNKVDREWVDRLVAHDLKLYQEKRRLGGSTEPFQKDELQQTVIKLDHLFSTAVGKVQPPMAGVATLPTKPGRKRGAG